MGVFIVAEMSANHKGDFDTAKKIIEAAKNCKADAVKCQVFTPDDMAKKDDKVIGGGLWKGRNLYELYKEAATPLEWIPKLKEFADEIGIELFPTVYSPNRIRFCEDIGFQRYKISSFEITDLGLIEAVAQTGKPVIISTGMAELNEIHGAVDTVRKVHSDLTLLKCTSEYPAPIEKLNLKTIRDMMAEFSVSVGFSDHTDNMAASMVATACGASVIEKHITLDKDSIDGAFSDTPEQFANYVTGIRYVEAMLGKVEYGGEKHFRRTNVDGRMLRTYTADSGSTIII